MVILKDDSCTSNNDFLYRKCSVVKSKMCYLIEGTGLKAAPVRLPAWEPIFGVAVVVVVFVDFIVFDVSLTVDFAVVLMSEIDAVSEIVSFSKCLLRGSVLFRSGHGGIDPQSYETG